MMQNLRLSTLIKHFNKNPKPPPFFHQKPTPLVQYKSRIITTEFHDKMVVSNPVAVGTRGTVGSLVRKEIEYFAKIDLDRCGSSSNPQEQMMDMDSTTTACSRPCFWSLTLSWKRKKRRSSNSGFIIPGICSAVEVAETNLLNGISGFSYRILKNDDEETF